MKKNDTTAQSLTVACIVAISDDNEILAACKESQQLHKISIWEFPGGRLREGERLEQCAIRRFKDELNLDTRIVDALNSCTTRIGNRDITVHPFLGQIIGGSPILYEHKKAEWFRPDQLFQLAWPDSDMPIVEQIVERYITQGRII